MLKRLLVARKLLNEWFAAAIALQEYHPFIQKYFEKSATLSLEALDLDEGLNPGKESGTEYTLKTIGAGFWALQHAQSYEDGILQIIHEGGNADTNAAVAVALLGS